MRIIGGKKGGLKIFINKKLRLRPTTDKCKEGLFNMLSNRYDFEKLNVSLPKMIFDLPKGGKRLVQESFGYLATIKSGEVVYENGQATGTLPGQVIRGKQTSEASRRHFTNSR